MEGICDSFLNSSYNSYNIYELTFFVVDCQIRFLWYFPLSAFEWRQHIIYAHIIYALEENKIFTHP